MAQHPYEREDLLQKLLANFPSVLGGDQFDSEEPKRWLLISRDADVPSQDAGASRWSIDHLFIDQDKIPTFVEVKRSSDTRIRREVVGQILEYASNAVVYWPENYIRQKYEKRFENDEAASQEITRCLDVDFDEEDPNAIDLFWKAADDNLRDGRIRLIFVSDSIPAELRRIVEFLNGQMRAEVLAIEIRQFTAPGVTTLVPTIFGQTEQTAAKTVRLSGSGPRPPLPAFVAIINAYDASRGQLPPTSGTAPGYRHVRLPGWPIPVKYEFMRRGKSVLVQLGAPLEIYPNLVAVLSPLAGKMIGDGHATLRWEPGDGGQHKG